RLAAVERHRAPGLRRSAEDAVVALRPHRPRLDQRGIFLRDDRDEYIIAETIMLRALDALQELVQLDQARIGPKAEAVHHALAAAGRAVVATPELEKRQVVPFLHFLQHDDERVSGRGDVEERLERSQLRQLAAHPAAELLGGLVG